MPSFGESSQRRLSTCDADIRIICEEAIKIIDFSIITGHRTKEAQNALYPKYTKLHWPDGKHNAFPSKAVDVAPYIHPYGVIFGNKKQLLKIQEDLINEGKSISLSKINDFVLKSYARLIGYIEAIAANKDIDIRVGIDWDGDFNMLDQSFHDLGHWELKY